jgi:hypothetical protein
MTPNQHLSHVHGVTFPEPERKPSDSPTVAKFARILAEAVLLEAFGRGTKQDTAEAEFFLTVALDVLAGKERP